MGNSLKSHIAAEGRAGTKVADALERNDEEEVIIYYYKNLPILCYICYPPIMPALERTQVGSWAHCCQPAENPAK